MPVPYMTNVTLYSGVPWDNTYTDVRYFDGGNVSIPGQVLYNSGATYTYQRVNSSVEGGRPSYTLRVNRPAGELYNCNYMSFNNNDVQGGKTFYCFVNKVNYVAPDTTELVYEIDEFTTWFYDCTVQSCFVEREHSSDDVLNDNLVNEPFNALDMLEVEKETYFLPYTAIHVFTTGPISGTKVAEGSLKFGQYLALNDYGIAPLSEQEPTDLANNYIQAYNENDTADRILYVNTVKVKNYNNTLPPQTDSFIISRPTDVDGYVPRNNKLLTGQFNQCKLYSSDGSSTLLCYEYFSTIPPSFAITTSGNVDITLSCIPNYGNTTGQKNYNYALTCPASIQSAWLKDDYAAYYGTQRGLTVINNLINTIASTITGASTGNKPSSVKSGAKQGLIQGLVEGSVNSINNEIAAQRLAADPKGGLETSVSFALNRVGFFVAQRCVTREVAERLDWYFDWYGYATMAPKQPNLTGRSLFNYVKTQDAIITGAIPAESMAAIKQMFNNGIRLWHTNKVGQYDPATGNPIG